MLQYVQVQFLPQQREKAQLEEKKQSEMKST